MVYKPKAQQSGGSVVANVKKTKVKKQKSEMNLEAEQVKQEVEILDATASAPTQDENKKLEVDQGNES